MTRASGNKCERLLCIPFSLRKRVLKDDEIGFLCPSYEGFLSLREEHFLDAQRETDVQADSNCYM